MPFDVNQRLNTHIFFKLNYYSVYCIRTYEFTCLSPFSYHNLAISHRQHIIISPTN